MKTNSLLGLAIVLTAGLANAAEPLNLTFSRTGNDAASVTVTADVDGVNASLTSVSHSLKAFGSTALCPDANGNTSPTIVMTFSIADLPAGWSFNKVGLDIHAFNGQGGNQQHNDNKKRQFNVSVTSGDRTLVTYTDLDPAAGIQGVRKVWEAGTASVITPGSPMELTITVTKGTQNEGCFFGLEGITLSTDNSAVNPDPDPYPEPDSKFYTIKWKNDTQSYMTEQPDGSIAIGDYATFNKVFWEFIPTDNANCYYIRNTATGNYLGSCNMEPSSASRVTMSATPVEYYVQLSASTEGANRGCYWLSSTDCANYDKEDQSARCLNKDGASAYVITWRTGIANKGSYWTLTETENLYEPRPFTPQPAIGAPQATYFIVDAQGRSYSRSGEWKTFSPTANDAKWYFVGTSNAAGGYQIVSAADNTPLNSGALYRLTESEGAAPYHFVGPGDATAMLSLAGVDAFNFVAARTPFALNNQIYRIPCGPIGDTWIAAATIGSDFRYPMPVASGNQLTQPTVTSKPQKYTMLSRDAATVNPGTETPLNVTINKAPAEAYQLIVCYDWDRDGLFEASTVMAASQTMNATITVPADAAPGKTRLRLRLTSNGQLDPDADVNGQILDLLLNVSQPSATPLDPVVRTNDATRGTAEWTNGIAKATSLGNALFLYWQEGLRIVGVDASLEVAPSANPRVLTAVFTANTSPFVGIDNVLLNTVDTDATIVFADGKITVAGADSIAIVLYSTGGSAVASAATSLNVAAVTPGIYIVKAITSTGVVSAKLKI
mgnify:CR=1 FL=1